MIVGSARSFDASSARRRPFATTSSGPEDAKLHAVIFMHRDAANKGSLRGSPANVENRRFPRRKG